MMCRDTIAPIPAPSLPSPPHPGPARAFRWRIRAGGSPTIMWSRSIRPIRTLLLSRGIVGNHGLGRSSPLERHHCNVICGRTRRSSRTAGAADLRRGHSERVAQSPSADGPHCV